MPIVDGEEKLNITAAQLDELIFNINFGAVDYKTLQSTPHVLFSNKTVAPSTFETSLGIPTGNNAKMSVTFAQTGTSTNCTMYLYGSDFADLSLAASFTVMTLGAGSEPVTYSIAPHWIPAYTFCKCVNNDTSKSAICTVNILTWK